MANLGKAHVEALEARDGLTRRQLFVRGALATAGLALSGLILRFVDQLRDHPRPGLVALSDREAEILARLLTVFFPGAEGMPRADPAVLLPQIDAFVARTDPDARFLFRALLHVVEDQCLVQHGTRFTRATDELCLAEIRAWELTPIYTKRSAFKSLKLFSAMAYMEQPETRAVMGWRLGCSPQHLRHLAPEGVRS